MRCRSLVPLSAVVLLLLAPRLAQAERPSPLTPSESLKVDVEVDPLAYALSGFSLHAGLAYKHLRVDLGNYGMTLPRFAQPNREFDVSFVGFGLKAQYFFLASQAGLFAGADAGITRSHLVRSKSSEHADFSRVGVGVHGGYRIDLFAGVYITPWVGFSYTFAQPALNLGDATYRPSSFSVFPAIHVGYHG